MALKPQDVLCCLKIFRFGTKSWSTRELASSVGISASETHNVLTRCREAGLTYKAKEDVRISTRKLYDFLIFGVPVAFYAQRGPVTRGLPTSAFAPPLSDKLNIVSTDIQLVWPYSAGKVRGESLQPLYPTVPAAALADDELYQLLVLVDALRVGKARERKFAVSMLGKRLLGRDDEVEELREEVA